MKLPALFQFRVLKLALQSLFSRPFTTSFPKEPFEPIPQFRGRPRYSSEGCIGCGACAEVCPPKCIDVIDDTGGPKPIRRLIQHLDSCICCGQCERYCTSEKGIRLTNEFDFVGFAPADFCESVEKELVLCEHCGQVMAARDHLKWLYHRLGPLAFDNPVLLLSSLSGVEVIDPGLKTDSKRGRYFHLQCPKCRRHTALEV